MRETQLTALPDPIPAAVTKLEVITKLAELRGAFPK